MLDYFFSHNYPEAFREDTYSDFLTPFCCIAAPEQKNIFKRNCFKKQFGMLALILVTFQNSPTPERYRTSTPH